MSTELAPRKDTRPLLARTAERFGVDADKMATTMKSTCFRQRGRDGEGGKEVSNEQLMALLIVSEQFGLNPFTKEIFAFPDGGGIVPMISVDGWIRIINEHPQFDGVEFQEGPTLDGGPYGGLPEWIDCAIFRKDRTRPLVIREYMVECFNERSPVWKKSPRRFLRHRALIQCGRVAFGFSGGCGVADDADLYDVTPVAALPEAKPVKANDRAAALLEKAKTAPVVEPKPEPKPVAAPVPAKTSAQIDREILEADATGYGEAP
jgi:phage recombination protein Bet